MVGVQTDRRKQDEAAKPATLRLMRDAVERNPGGLTGNQICEACESVPMRRAERMLCLGYLVESGSLRREKLKQGWLYFPGGGSRRVPEGPEKGAGN